MNFTGKYIALFSSSLVAVAACSGAPESSKNAAPVQTETREGPGPAQSLPGAVQPKIYTQTVVATYPHAPQTFTQGLLYKDGFLYESTGQYGATSVRKTVIETGEVVQIRNFGSEHFGEGLTLWKDKLIMLTWQQGLGFVLDSNTFEEEATFGYPGEGWGLTHNETHLIQSDGTNILRFLDPDTFKISKTLPVRMNGRPLQRINELEWIDGQIWANVWQSDIIVRIDPESGNVVDVIDVANLFPRNSRERPDDHVPNGIAYDPSTGRIFVTGKHWPNMFEIEVSEVALPE